MASGLLLALWTAACGASPRPVVPTPESGWPTTQGNAQRAAFEHETIGDTLDVVWDIDVGRGLRTSVLLTDSALFAATTSRQLIAYETRTGRRRWYQRLEGEMASEIVRSGRTLFVTTTESSGKIHARDMERGRQVWKQDIGAARFSPLVDAGLVYVGTDRGYVHALRSEDGEQVWRLRAGGALASTPINHQDAVIVATVTDTLLRLAKRDGTVLARGTLPGSISAAPALNGDTIVVPTQTGAVIGIDANTLTELWRVETGAPVLAAPIVGRDGTIHVLNRDAQIWRINNRRGTRVAAVQGAATSSFTLARDRYVVGLIDGTLLITDLAGRVVTEHKFNDSIYAPVAILSGALYVPFLHGRLVKLR